MDQSTNRGRYDFTDEDLTALGLGSNSSGNLGTSIINILTSPATNSMPCGRTIHVSLNGSSYSIYADGTIYETDRSGTSMDGVYIDRASHRISYTRGPNSRGDSVYGVNQYLYGEISPADVISGYIDVTTSIVPLRNYICTIQLINKELVVVPY